MVYFLCYYFLTICITSSSCILCVGPTRWGSNLVLVPWNKGKINVKEILTQEKLKANSIHYQNYPMPMSIFAPSFVLMCVTNLWSLRVCQYLYFALYLWRCFALKNSSLSKVLVLNCIKFEKEVSIFSTLYNWNFNHQNHDCGPWYKPRKYIYFIIQGVKHQEMKFSAEDIEHSRLVWLFTQNFNCADPLGYGV